MTSDQSNPPVRDGPTTSNPDGLSDEMAALYDRQLRLWGVDVQQKLGKAHLLIIRCGPVMAELAKNLVLGGIGKVTVCDEGDRIVTESQRGDVFLLPMAENGGVGMKYADAVLPHLRTLSPYTKISSVHVPSIGGITPEFLSEYDVVAATDLPFPTMCALNDASRLANKPFLSVSTAGVFGYAFADLGDTHEYVHRVARTGSRGAQVGPVSDVREIISVEPESKADARKPGEADVEAFERVLTRDRYVPLRTAMEQPLPSEMVRWMVRQSKHTLARGTTEAGLSGPSVITCLRAMFLFEEAVMSEDGKVAQPMSAIAPELFSPSGIDQFIKHIPAAHQKLGLPPTVPLPGAPVVEEFWKIYTASATRESIQSPTLAAQLVGTASCLGGVMAEQVISLLGRREPVLQNWLIFDGHGFSSPAMAMIGKKVEPVVPGKLASAEAEVIDLDLDDVMEPTDGGNEAGDLPASVEKKDKGKESVLVLDD